MAKPKTVTLAYVVWDDACSITTFQYPRLFDARFRLESAGILVRDDKEFISLAQQRETDSDPRCRDVLHIPRSLVVTVQKVKVPVKKEKP